MLLLRAIFIIRTNFMGAIRQDIPRQKEVCHKRTKKTMHSKKECEERKRLSIKNEIYHPFTIARNTSLCTPLRVQRKKKKAKTARKKDSLQIISNKTHLPFTQEQRKSNSNTSYHSSNKSSEKKSKR